MKNVIYQVSKNLNLTIIEKEYIKKSNSFYWDEFGREALETKYNISFDKKEDAINYLKYKLSLAISSAKNTMEHYQKELEKFNLEQE